VREVLVNLKRNGFLGLTEVQRETDRDRARRGFDRRRIARAPVRALGSDVSTADVDGGREGPPRSPGLRRRRAREESRATCQRDPSRIQDHRRGPDGANAGRLSAALRPGCSTGSRRRSRSAGPGLAASSVGSTERAAHFPRKGCPQAADRLREGREAWRGSSFDANGSALTSNVDGAYPGRSFSRTEGGDSRSERLLRSSPVRLSPPRPPDESSNSAHSEKQ
jgi:hypothetical protein